MQEMSFSAYCESFLKNPNLGSKLFFQGPTQAYTYKQLIEAAFGRAHYFINSPDTFFALKLESPYTLFTNLLGAIFAQKNVLILSSNEPSGSITRIQAVFPITNIITDHYTELASHNFDFPEIKINSTRPAFFILSSGSSGPAKGIPLSLHNVFHSSRSVIDFFKMTSQDTSFLNLPHHHIGGLMILWRAFFSMGKVTTLESDNYQFISLVPLQLRRMMNDEDKISKLIACRGVLIGGSPLDLDLKEQSLKMKIPVFETYGMSETCSLVMLNGKPLTGQEIKLSTDGSFLIKGPTLSSSVPLDENGFYHTKDIGVQNQDGTFSFKHRGDLLFKSGGELINPLVIETKLKELPWIVDAIVVPIKHHEWTFATSLVFETCDSTKGQDDIKDYLKKHLHPFWVPKFYFKASSDQFPKGIKPKRYDISRFAQKEYFHNLFHHQFIPKDNSNKLTVFFHGFMEDHTDLFPLMNENKDSSYLFIDLPGHGKTKTSSFKNRSSIFLELKSLIDFYKSDLELIIYGYSMGGRVAIELTLMGLTPSILILESAHMGLNTSAEKEARLNSDLKLFSNYHNDPKIFFEEWYKNPIFGNYSKTEHFKKDIEKKVTHDALEWQKSLEYFSPGSSPFVLDETLQKLSNQKILAILGTEDKKYTNHYESIKSKMPQLSVHEIDNCGHNPHKTHPAVVKKVLS